MELIIVQKDSPEWEYMWSWLENHPVNKDIEEPRVALHEGEAWQYMGSFKNKDKVVHEFRHRKHPVTNNRYTASVSGSDDFTNEQIEDSLRIK